MPMHISQSVTPSLMFKSQSLMIHTKKMHQSSMKIMDMYSVLNYIVTKIVGFAVGKSRFYARSSHPHGKCFWVVITAVVSLCQLPLGVYGAAKFSTPNN